MPLTLAMRIGDSICLMVHITVICLCSGKCNASSEFRVQWYLNCSEFFLVSQEIGQASQQVKKAHAIINECKNPSLLLKFKTLYARVLDQERKFLEAALRYMELSQLNTQAGVTEQDLLQSLEYAVSTGLVNNCTYHPF